MKLSILDQSPISAGMTAKEALQASVKRAKHGEKLGYERFWIAEHHDLFGLACSNPSVMLGVIGAQTNTIRIGAGAVLLPYYQPFHVAETYNLLATLFPGRIDLGLGRAPGGSAEVSLALSDNYLAAVQQFPEKIDELQRFLQQADDDISPTPIPTIGPETWLLGTSEKSAILAAEKGVNYAFGHFMTEQDGPLIVDKYRTEMTKKHLNLKPYAIVAIQVICAETTERANDLAQSYFLWKIKQDSFQEDRSVPSVNEAKQYPFSTKELDQIEAMKKQMLIGSPNEVRAGLMKLDATYKADEYMILTIVHEISAQLKSYELIKSILGGYL